MRLLVGGETVVNSVVAAFEPSVADAEEFCHLIEQIGSQYGEQAFRRIQIIEFDLRQQARNLCWLDAVFVEHLQKAAGNEVDRLDRGVAGMS